MAMICRPKLLIAGLVVVAFGVAVMFANGSERAEAVADELVEATAVLPENEGKLVIVSGTPQLADGGIITDEEAGLRVENAVYYSRVPLQKVYVKKQRQVVVDEGEDKLSEVDDVKEIEYYVAQEWIGASHEREAEVSVTSVRYENPSRVKLDAYHASGDLRICGFGISAADVRDHIETATRWFAQGELEAACGSYITRSEIGLRAVTDENGHGMLNILDSTRLIQSPLVYSTFLI